MRRAVSLTIPELEQALEQKRSALIDLERRRDSLSQELDAVNSEIAVLLPTGRGRQSARKMKRTRRTRRTRVAAGAPTIRRRSSRGSGRTLREVVYSVLARSSNPLGLKEIESAVKKARYKSKSKNLVNLISQLVYTDGSIVRAGPGKFKAKAA